VNRKPEERTRRYRELAQREPRFQALLDTYGKVDPFAWPDGGRTAGSKFAALVLHIAGQRITATAAFAVFDRIAALTGGIPQPTTIAALDVMGLRATGLSGSKARYILALAESEISGRVDLESLGGLPDREVLAVLTSLPGIGTWTAQMFLVRQLHRPDVLPAGDPGIRNAVQELLHRKELPSISATEAVARNWSPNRSYAAALLWRSLAPADQIADPKERALAKEARKRAGG